MKSKQACSHSGSIPWFSLALAVLATGLFYLGGPGLLSRLALERASGGGLWITQLWTSALVHVSPRHLALNLAAMLLALGWLEYLSRRSAIWVSLCAAPVSALVVMGAMPEVSAYCGLSCVIHGAVGGLLVLGWKRGMRGMALWGLLAIGVKLALEWGCDGGLFGLGAEGLFKTTPPGHLAGLVAGVMSTFLVGAGQRNSNEVDE